MAYSFRTSNAHPGGSDPFIGRYSKRACISEHKITNIEGAYITFSYKNAESEINIPNRNAKLWLITINA